MNHQLSDPEERCLSILLASGQPDRVIRHCIAVAKTARVLAKRLSDQGYPLDISLCYRSGLVHDICRTKKRHAEQGEKYLTSLGLHKEAGIVAVHMGENLDSSRIDEHTVVFLADKITSGGSRVSVSQRFKTAFERYANEPEILEAVKARFETALSLETRFTQALGKPLSDLSFD
jgi:HD superfamily phosphohydrolase YqeK